MTEKVLVLGGGISGLGVAWKLAEQGYAVEVIEKLSEPGGLSGTIQEGPYRLDYGPHFILSEDPELLKQMIALFPEELPLFRRSAQLYFNGHFYNYPLTARNVLMQMPFTDALLSGSSYFLRLGWDRIRKLWSRSEAKPTFADWARSSFGDYLFKLFFKPYTEQFWQIPVDELSPDSMPTNTRLSFFKTLKLLFVKDIVKAKMSLVERETTLMLRYPRQGIGEMSRLIIDKINQDGGQVHHGWSVNTVERSNGDHLFRVIAGSGSKRRIFEGSRVISTIPITELIPCLRPLPPADVIKSNRKLGFLSLIIVYLVIPKREILKSSYVYHLATPYNRIGDMNRFCPDLCPADENMLALEFTCHFGDRRWKASREELVEEALIHLEKDEIINRKEIKRSFVLKAPHAYPIYTYQYSEHLERVRQFIDEAQGLDIVGRSGNYQYMDMDQCLAEGFKLVSRITG